MKNPTPLAVRAILTILVAGLVISPVINRLTPDQWWVAIIFVLVVAMLMGRIAS